MLLETLLLFLESFQAGHHAAAAGLALARVISACLIIGFQLGQGQVMNSNTNSVVINGLTATTNYDVYVRSICSGDDTGSWTRGTYQTAMCDSPVIFLEL